MENMVHLIKVVFVSLFSKQNVTVIVSWKPVEAILYNRSQKIMMLERYRF